MATTKPTIVIAHGAWQTSEGFSGFIVNLKKKGFSAIVPPLPSVGGTSSPLPGLAEDVEVVKSVLSKLADDGKEIILLCHSYGGVVGSCAVEGLDAGTRAKGGKKGGVVKVVFMSAFMVPKGKSLLEMLGGQPLPWMRLGGDRCVAVIESMPQVAFNDLSAETAAQCCTQMTHSSASVFSTPSIYEPWANEIPCAYILCSEDRALPFPVQRGMSIQLGPEPETYTLKSSHCPFLSIPDQLVEVIEMIAKA